MRHKEICGIIITTKDGKWRTTNRVKFIWQLIGTLFPALSDYLKADNYFSYNVMIDLTPLSLRYWQSILVQ